MKARSLAWETKKPRSISSSAASHELCLGTDLARAPPRITKGRKLRPRCRPFAPAGMPSEQLIHSRWGLDISISRLVVDETANNNQAIEALSAALRPCRSPAVDW